MWSPLEKAMVSLFPAFTLVSLKLLVFRKLKFHSLAFNSAGPCFVLFFKKRYHCSLTFSSFLFSPQRYSMNNVFQKSILSGSEVGPAFSDQLMRLCSNLLFSSRSHSFVTSHLAHSKSLVTSEGKKEWNRLLV